MLLTHEAVSNSKPKIKPQSIRNEVILIKRSKE